MNKKNLFVVTVIIIAVAYLVCKGIVSLFTVTIAAGALFAAYYIRICSIYAPDYEREAYYEEHSVQRSEG